VNLVRLVDLVFPGLSRMASIARFKATRPTPGSLRRHLGDSKVFGLWLLLLQAFCALFTVPLLLYALASTASGWLKSPGEFVAHPDWEVLLVMGLVVFLTRQFFRTRCQMGREVEEFVRVSGLMEEGEYPLWCEARSTRRRLAKALPVSEKTRPSRRL
jgi:hypothetical protein